MKKEWMGRSGEGKGRKGKKRTGMKGYVDYETISNDLLPKKGLCGGRGEIERPTTILVWVIAFSFGIPPNFAPKR